MAEEQIVVVAQSHAAQDNLVHVGAEGDVGHYLVVGLVRIGEEWNLLTGHQGVVEVDAGDAGGDELRRLAALVRVHGRAADLALLAFNLRPAVDGMAVGVEESARKLVGYLEGRGFSEEGDFRVGGDAFGSGENLEGDQVSLGTYDLGQAAGHHGQLVIAHTGGPERNRGLGDAFQLGIDSLVCFDHGYAIIFLTDSL